MKWTSIIPILILVFANQSQAANQCIELFTAPTMKQMMNMLNPVVLTEKQSKKFDQAGEFSKNTVTGARKEVKFALIKENMTRIMATFKDKVQEQIKGFILTHRDATILGKLNITWTAYSNRFTLIFGKLELRLKIRARKFGTIDSDKEITKDNFLAIEWMKDKSFLEFKFENPEQEQTVLKPRVLMFDKDMDLLLNPELTKEQYREIEIRTRELNPNTNLHEKSDIDLTIHYMLKAIRGLHKKGTLFRPEFETLYERVSYKIPLINKETDEKYEVQITLDENIKATSLLFGVNAESYKNQTESIVVAEVKIPISMIEQLKNKNFKDVPGLEAVAFLLEAIDFNSLKQFQDNSGKLYHLIRDVKTSLENMFKDDNNKTSNEKKD